MRRSKIEYGRLVEEALRTVVRDVLVMLQRGETGPMHHFYITFRTQASGVVVGDFLKQRYPSEMTIVLQHQYWDLEVEEDGFAVTLTFNDVPERLIIPFSAVKVFADPGVEFGLHFTLEAESESETGTAVAALPSRARPEAVPSAEDAEQAGEPEPGNTAEIVALDRFRKK